MRTKIHPVIEAKKYFCNLLEWVLQGKIKAEDFRSSAFISFKRDSSNFFSARSYNL
jgi:hypothetical protein